jgi:hypothetical protein
MERTPKKCPEKVDVCVTMPYPSTSALVIFF